MSLQLTSSGLQTISTVGTGSRKLAVDACRAQKKRQRPASQKPLLYFNSTESTQNDYEDVAPMIPSISSKEYNEHLIGEEIRDSAPSAGDPDTSDGDNGNETNGKVLEAPDPSDLLDCCYGMVL
jgi:hypothetical protein